MPKVEVDINPEILKWAREEAGFEVFEIAEKMKIPPERYSSWEDEGTEIPLGKLKTLATSFKRQLATFFLPKVPEKLKKPKDYRNLSPEKSKLSAKVIMAMRDAEYFSKKALEFEGESYWQERYAWLDDKKQYGKHTKKLTQWLRETLNIFIEDQLAWNDSRIAYNNWRQAIENHLGIFVFQFSMPLDEVQGFCLTDKYPYAIVVNSKHPYVARIFTIFHELAHILRQDSCMCIVDKVKESQEEEWRCNSFAGNFLVPTEYLHEANDLEEIEAYARKLKISREVYLRRLEEEGKIPKPKFFKLLDQLKASYQYEKKAGGGPVSPEVKARASRGPTFYNLVLDSLNQKKLTYSEASSLLDLRINRILNEV